MDHYPRMGLFHRGLYYSSALYPRPGFYTGSQFYAHEERANPPTLEASQFHLQPDRQRTRLRVTLRVMPHQPVVVTLIRCLIIFLQQTAWYPSAVAQSVTHQIDPLAHLRPTVGRSPYPIVQDVPATRAQLVAGPPSLSVSQPHLPVGLSSRPVSQRVPISQLIHGPSPLSATQAAPQPRPRVRFEPSVLSETKEGLDQPAAPSITHSSPRVEHKPPIKNAEKNLVEPKPADAGDQTTPHGDQAFWSLENLPDVLYVLRPRSDYRKSRHRVYKTTNAITGKQINDFAVLPSQISSNVEGWRLEAWMRLDRRITQQDIIDRVNPEYKLTADEIETRRENFRDTFHVANWNAQKSIWAIDRMLKATGIDTQKNSTRGLTPGLIDPSKGEAGGRIPIPGENIIPMVKQPSMNPKPALGSSGEMCEGHRPGPSHASHADLRTEPRSHEIEAEQRTSQQDLAMDSNARATTLLQIKTVDSTHADFEYPDVDGLTYCNEPPAQPFDDEDDTVDGAMTLENFLKKNNMSYEDWLLRDCDAVDRNTLKRGRDEDLESQEPMNVIASPKRRRVDNPDIEASVTMNNTRKRRRAEDTNVDESTAGEDSPKRRRIETLNTGKPAKKSSDDFWATVLKA
ncbi:uncharacterized protein CDV56_103308 [Aspergillus thermomutatus]|uniref:Uncharacterized protein n=1 Tax=Aspergillus thermomutatus TaxID=41047 RepID=A0A397G042_ASPTH|nr:uncharacterized protein CDV56_103308 [Aspergillus thermomutatus]RHZ44412.1 hypothetical protein CDV56_103308 [Aspergillus thermomutatus]